MDREEGEELFFKKIKEYNDRKEYYDHYVRFKEDHVLFIFFKKGLWGYGVEKLENE